MKELFFQSIKKSIRGPNCLLAAHNCEIVLVLTDFNMNESISASSLLVGCIVCPLLVGQWMALYGTREPLASVYLLDVLRWNVCFFLLEDDEIVVILMFCLEPDFNIHRIVEPQCR